MFKRRKSSMSDLIIEAGKRYVTRNGWVTPPLEFDDEFMEDYPFYAGDTNDCSIGIQSWTRSGLCHRLGKLVDGADLVREFVPEQQVPGVPDGWRIVRFGLIETGEHWMAPTVGPQKWVSDSDSRFHCLVVERIASV
jgi:hypothetical protein